MEDQIVPDEYENIQEQEDNQIFTQDATNTEVVQILPEEIDIYTPFFTGLGIAGTMCLLSLGVAVILQIFRRA